jgi:sigma-E factor negative regulatory protein RseC
MIEEYGRVIAVKGENVWIETTSKTGCGKCSAEAGCGQGFLAKFNSGKRNHIRIKSELALTLDDQVLIGIPEDALVKSSLLIYGAPLLSFILFVVIADNLLHLSEPGAIAFGLFGLVLGFFLAHICSRWAKGAVNYQPVILKKLSGNPVCMSPAPSA